MGKSSGSAPAAPDPYQTAAAQYQYGTAAASYNAALNRTNTGNVAGTSNWTVTGTDPTTGAPIYGYQQSLAPQFAAQASKPIDTSGLQNPTVGGQQDIRDALYNQQMAYIKPQQDISNEALDARLAAQGATIGSDAWNNEESQQNRNNTFQNNQAINSAITGATGQEATLQNVANQGIQGNIAAGEYGPQLFNLMNPSNVATASTSAPDIMGAFQNQYQGQLNAYNAQQASNNAMTSDLFGLGGMGIMAYAMSDRKMKTDIKRVGSMENGLPVYTFKYKGDEKTQIGVMADEVEKVIPSAVIERDGIKYVNYGALT